uniref:ORF-163 n=1 Tax=Physarum polycephalum TaxID=5791 RepID=Q35592_PHYPO|nr:unassigned reading frame [Physarum polycephalum]AAC15941.1 unassigned reading frame [Physarum polycephalum]BAA06114.1 ORF-163 [Physarum polycephalum]
MNNINKIEIIKPLYELCPCVIPRLYNNFFYTFKQYRVNCLLRFLETEHNAFYNDPKNKLIIYVQDYPVDLESDYLKDIHYSFLYRKQQQLPLPPLVSDLTKKSNLLLYIDFLIMEYLDACSIENTSTFSNPFFDYMNDFFCFAIEFPKKLKENILIIPYIHNN